MGCCQSREDHDEDDIRAPLLPGDTTTDNVINYQTYDTIDAKQEEQFWNDVINRTTHHLIDIAMSQPDPLQEQDIQDRTEKYQQWLQHYEANLPVSSTANVQPVVDLTSVVTAIRAHPTITSAQREQIDELADRVQQAMRKIEVQPVGDIVIQLTMPESMSIASY